MGEVVAGSEPVLKGTDAVSLEVPDEANSVLPTLTPVDKITVEYSVENALSDSVRG